MQRKLTQMLHNRPVAISPILQTYVIRTLIRAHTIA